MNVAYYVLIFDHATDAALDRLDVGEAYRRRAGCSVFVGEMHVNYRQEVVEGDALTVGTRLLAMDERRLVLFHEMTCSRFRSRSPAMRSCAFTSTWRRGGRRHGRLARSRRSRAGSPSTRRSRRRNWPEALSVSPAIRSLSRIYPALTHLTYVEVDFGGQDPVSYGIRSPRSSAVDRVLSASAQPLGLAPNSAEPDEFHDLVLPRFRRVAEPEQDVGGARRRRRGIHGASQREALRQSFLPAKRGAAAAFDGRAPRIGTRERTRTR